MNRPALCLVTVAFVAAAAVTGCSGGRPKAGGSAARGKPKAQARVPRRGDFDGSWSGRTAQGRQIKFTVERNTLGRCTTIFRFENLVVERSRYQGRPIRGNAFSAVDRSTPPLVFTIKGRFVSRTEASGTILVEKKGGGSLSIAWKAKKER